MMRRRKDTGRFWRGIFIAFLYWILQSTLAESRITICYASPDAWSTSQVSIQRSNIQTSESDFGWQHIVLGGGDEITLVIDPSGYPSLSFIRGIGNHREIWGGPTMVVYASNNGNWVDGLGWSIEELLYATDMAQNKASLQYNYRGEPQIAYANRYLDDSGYILNMARKSEANGEWLMSSVDPEPWVYQIKQVTSGNQTYIFYVKGNRVSVARSSDGVTWDILRLDQPTTFIISPLDAAVNRFGTVGVVTAKGSGDDRGLYYGWTSDEGNTWEVVHVDDSADVIGPSLTFDPDGNPIVTYSSRSSSRSNFDRNKIAWSPDGGQTWRIEVIPEFNGGPTAVAVAEGGEIFVVSAVKTTIENEVHFSVYLGVTVPDTFQWQFQQVDDVYPKMLGTSLDILITPEQRLLIGYVTVEDAPFTSTYRDVKLAWSEPIPVIESIVQGWNTFSLRRRPQQPWYAQDVLDQINAQEGHVTEIDRWDSPTGNWVGHIDGLPIGNFEVTPGEGYFVKSLKESTWSYQGEPITTAIPVTLARGWNFVSFPYLECKLSAETLCQDANAQGHRIFEIDRWNNEVQNWVGHPCGLPFADFSITTTDPYFVKTENESAREYYPCASPESIPVSSPMKREQQQSQPQGTPLDVEDLLFEGARILDVEDGEYLAAYPSVVLGEDGEMYIVWAKAEFMNGAWEFALMFSKSEDEGVSFSSTVVAQISFNGDIFPQLVVEGERIYVVWQNPINGSTQWEVVVARSDDGGKSFPQQTVVATTSSHPSGDHDSVGLLPKPQIVVKGDNVGVVWKDYEGNSDGALYFAYSEDGGKSFSGPQRIGTERWQLFDALLASEDEFYIAATHYPDSRSRLFKGTLQGNFVTVTDKVNENDNIAQTVKLAAGRNGRIYIGWLGQDLDSINNFTYIRWTDDGGETFSAQQLIDSTLPGQFLRNTLSLQLLDDQSLIVVDSRRYNGLYAYVSRDGGETFSSAIPLHEGYDPETFAFSKIEITLNDTNLWVIWDDMSFIRQDFRLVGNHASRKPPKETFVFELKSGWNFIGFFLETETPYTASSLINAIDEQGGDCEEVDMWDASLGNWRGYIRGVPLDDFSIEPYRGYFLRCNRPSTFIIEGRRLPFDLQEVFQPTGSGWYTLSVPVDGLYTAETLCQEINTNYPGECIEISKWVEDLGNWQGYLAGYPFNNFPIERSSGYFIKYQVSEQTVNPVALPAPGQHQADVEVSGIEFYNPRSQERPEDKVSPIEGELVTCKAILKNTGEVETGVFNVKWYLDGKQVGYGSHASLGPGEISTGNVRFDWLPTAGTHTLRFVADVDNYVRESDEENNTFERRVTVQPILASLSGEVMNEKEGGIRDAKVYLIGKERKETKTGSRGEFSFSGVTPGRYKVIVQVSGYQRYKRSIELASQESKEIKVKLKKRRANYWQRWRERWRKWYWRYRKWLSSRVGRDKR